MKLKQPAISTASNLNLQKDGYNSLWSQGEPSHYGAAGARLRCKSKPNASSKLGPPSPLENLPKEGPSTLPLTRANTCDPMDDNADDESPTQPPYGTIPAPADLPPVITLLELQ